MAKPDRLTSPRDYGIVYRQGSVIANRHLVMYALKRSGPRSRVGIAVSRKLARAVDRNRIKRLLREAWRQEGRRIGCPYDIVIVGRESLVHAKSQTAASALADLFRRAQLDQREER